MQAKFIYEALLPVGIDVLTHEGIGRDVENLRIVFFLEFLEYRQLRACEQS